MREILFRGKRLDNNEWVEGYYVLDMGKHFILVKESRCNYRLSWFRIDLSTICQFIGLRDKNGKRIWEHDRYVHPKSGEEFVIKWDNSMSAFRAFYDSGGSTGTEMLSLQFGKGGAVRLGSIHDMEAEQ